MFANVISCSSSCVCLSRLHWTNYIRITSEQHTFRSTLGKRWVQKHFEYKNNKTKRHLNIFKPIELTKTGFISVYLSLLIIMLYTHNREYKWSANESRCLTNKPAKSILKCEYVCLKGANNLCSSGVWQLYSNFICLTLFLSIVWLALPSCFQRARRKYCGTTFKYWRNWKYPKKSTS